MKVDFLAVGHVTHDLTPDGIRLGGTVSYAAVTSWRLGRHPAILTRGSLAGLVTEPLASVLAETEVCCLPSAISTTFRNVYGAGSRVQVIDTVAAPITPAEMPAAWAEIPLVFLGPIARELPAAWADAFPHALVGMGAQGWMRTWDAVGHVRSVRWEDAADFLPRADVLFLSREDVGGDDDYIAELARLTRLMVVTDGWRGATIYRDGSLYPIAARSAVEVDPTGAGDVFGTAFLIRFAETGDPLVAGRFACVAASFSVEGVGMSAIPSREQVDAWLAKPSNGIRG